MRMNKAPLGKTFVATLLLIPFLLTAIAGCEGELGNQGEPQDPATEQPTTDPPSSTETPPPTSETDPEPKTTQKKPPIPVKDTDTDSIKVYWITAKNEDFALSASPLTLDESTPENEQLTQALERLVEGPANTNVTSAVPENTKLNQLSVKPDGIHLDLSKDFTAEGGSLSMQSRLGQVIYTASSIKPQTPIWISIDGEPLTVMGGEGLEISQPMTREEFNREFSI